MSLAARRMCSIGARIGRPVFGTSLAFALRGQPARKKRRFPRPAWLATRLGSSHAGTRLPAGECAVLSRTAKCASRMVSRREFGSFPSITGLYKRLWRSRCRVMAVVLAL